MEKVKINSKNLKNLATLRSLLKQVSSKWKWHTNTFSSFGKLPRLSFTIHDFFLWLSFGSLKKLTLSVFFLLELLVQSIAAQ